MKKKLLLVITILITILLVTPSCTGNYFVTPAFYEKAEGHRIIAILPFEMIFTGKKPKKLTIPQIRDIEEQESLAFQDSFYTMLMHQATRSTHPILVEIQAVDTTNHILEKKGITIRDTWEMNSEELAHLLNVDAVVRTRVIKKRFMSGLASFGIEVGNMILNEILEDTPLRIFAPNPTSGIKAECQVCDGRDGSVLWAIDMKDATDWTLPANEIIHNINHYFARNFPYR